MVDDNRQLLAYACEKFEEEKYDEALEIFAVVYMRGYEQNWIIETIYNCYMQGNEEEFKKTFQRYTENEEYIYEDCILDFIPYRDGEYYIFDKELGLFRGTFSASDLKKADLDPVFHKMEFSAAVLELDWNWKEEKSVLAAAENRKIYVICHDRKRCMSFFKLPELKEYMGNIRLFSDLSEFRNYFHQNTSVYLPKIGLGKDNADKILEILKQEHEFRLTPEGRNADNVLLTIGIPTHDRGNLLLKRLENLRKLPYDSEIEIAISKHGNHYYQEEYKSVERMKDARITYTGCDEELGISQNWRNAVKIAHGKFVILVSDEDDVILDALEYYMNFLNRHPKLSMLRPRTFLQYSHICNSGYYSKGEEAFLGGFLKQNYLSGIIYNKKIFESVDFSELDRNYENNAFYYLYPHMWWQVILSFSGDYAEENRYLIAEGDSVWKEETEKYEQDGLKENHGAINERPDIIDIVASLEARLEQFKGAVLLIKDCEMLDPDLKAKAFVILFSKTLYLMDMVQDCYTKEEFLSWVEKLVDAAIVFAKVLHVGSEREKYMLKNVESFLGWLDNKMNGEQI